MSQFARIAILILIFVGGMLLINAYVLNTVAVEVKKQKEEQLKK